MDRERVLNRIKKCLALSKSSNPGEAAAALRQAMRMMQKYGISQADLDLSEVAESSATASTSAQSPPFWMSELADTVSIAFGVSAIYELHEGTNRYLFVGVGPSAEVASYTFTVLRRLLVAAKSSYYKTLRGKRSNKVRKAAAFALGWVVAVKKKVEEFAQGVPAVVGRYVAERLVTRDLAVRMPRFAEADGTHANLGYLAGSDVDLHHGVNSSSRARIESAQ